MSHIRQCLSHWVHQNFWKGLIHYNYICFHLNYAKPISRLVVITRNIIQWKICKNDCLEKSEIYVESTRTYCFGMAHVKVIDIYLQAYDSTYVTKVWIGPNENQNTIKYIKHPHTSTEPTTLACMVTLLMGCLYEIVIICDIIFENYTWCS